MPGLEIATVRLESGVQHCKLVTLVLTFISLFEEVKAMLQLYFPMFSMMKLTL